jgi:protein-disulfide isomerase
VLGAALLLASGFAAGLYWTGPGVDRATTERVIHDYLLNNPEILPQAMERLERNRAAQVIDRQRDRIERPFSGAWAGAADGDVTMTVFTDYACTFCRASLADIDRLLREDRNLKVVFRELPILSPDSEPAARLALAAARRGRYMPMHRALFETGSPDADARRDAAVNLDVANDSAALGDAAITRELEGNIALARDLGIDGTPSWVIGDRMLTGAVGYDQLRAAISAARAGE